MSVEQRIAGMERLRKEATPGKWEGRDNTVRAERGTRLYVCSCSSTGIGPKDAAHIVSMQNSHEALLRVVRAAEVMLGAPAIEEAYVKAEYELREALDDFATEAKR